MTAGVFVPDLYCTGTRPARASIKNGNQLWYDIDYTESGNHQVASVLAATF